MLHRTHLVLATAARLVACVLWLVLAACRTILVDGISVIARQCTAIVRFSAIGRQPEARQHRPPHTDSVSLRGPTYVQEPAAPTPAQASLVRPVAADPLAKAPGQATTNGVHVLSVSSASDIHHTARVRKPKWQHAAENTGEQPRARRWRQQRLQSWFSLAQHKAHPRRNRQHHGKSARQTRRWQHMPAPGRSGCRSRSQLVYYRCSHAKPQPILQ
jgi:hypothetical protein